MQKRLLFWSYFLLGAMANISVLMLPFFYASKGMTDIQIVYLYSSTYLASIAQPFLGYITDTVVGPKKMLRNISIGIFLITILMYFSNGFTVMFILSFVFSMFRNATFPLFDNIAIGYCVKNDLEYGKIRQGGSLGFGLGGLISVPLYFLLGANAIILVPAILAVGVILIVKEVEYDARVHSDIHLSDYKDDLIILLKSKKYLLLVLIHLLIMGLCTLKLSYQSTYIKSFDASIFYMVIINIIIVAPEILFITKTKKMFEKYNISTVFTFLLALNIFHACILYFTTSLSVILVCAVFHGIVMSVYIPIFFEYLGEVMPPKTRATGYLINATFQSLGSFFINTFLIATFVKIYGIKGSFLVLIMLFAFGLIPVFLLFLVNKNQKIAREVI